jgi:hypothetical protein
MKSPIKALMATVLLSGMLVTAAPGAFAQDNPDPPHSGKISGRSVVAGALSLLIWPGIGQAVNSNKGEKVGTHAVLGLLPPYRIWSGYDALVDRHGGYWKGRI